VNIKRVYRLYKLEGLEVRTNLGGRLKSGQRWTGQNRPMARARDQVCFYPAVASGCNV